MSVQKVREALQNWRLESRVREFTISSATVEEAALAVGCEPSRIAKTMSFLVDGKAALIVMAGDAKISNPKFKSFFHQKAAMIPSEKVREYTGFVPGGVCPFAVPEGVTVYLDESLKRFDIVYPSGGNPQSAVELTLTELWSASRAKCWVDVSRLPESSEVPE